MKGLRPLPSKEEIEKVISYNPENGEFIWKRTSGRANIGDKARNISSKGYLIITINRKIYLAHRLAVFVCSGNDLLGVVIDHIDGNKLNNAISNLRICQQKQNCQNRKIGNKNNTSGYIGVFLDKRRGTWSAQITTDRKVRSITGFKSAEEASAAYIKAKREVHEFCTI